MYRNSQMGRQTAAESELEMATAQLRFRLQQTEKELELAKDRLGVAETDGKSSLVIYIKNYSLQEIPFF